MHIPQVYLQTNPWTCGPSCTMMAISCFDPDYKPNVEKETEIWQAAKTNNGNLQYTTHPKLAIWLLEKNFMPEIWQNHQDGFVYKPGPIGYWDFHKRMKYYKRFLEEARTRSIAINVRSFNTQDLVDRIQIDGSVAIIFSKVDNHSPIFHHRLLVGKDERGCKIYCPIQGEQYLTAEQVDQLMYTPYGKSALFVRPLR